jgi:hypothetical protein
MENEMPSPRARRARKIRMRLGAGFSFAQPFPENLQGCIGKLTYGCAWPLASEQGSSALQLEFTVEDEGVFTTAWSATVTYRRALGTILEVVCAENLQATYIHKDSAVPRADSPDF